MSVKLPFVYLKAFLLLMVLVLSAWLTVSLDLWNVFTDRQRLISLIEAEKTLSVFIFICLQILQVIVAFIPGELTGFIGGFIFGIVPGTIYSTAGLSIGSAIAFFIARYFGRPFVLLFMSHRHLERFDYLMEHRGTALSALLFVIPGFPKDYLCYILGLSRIRARVFIIISTFGRLVSTILLTISGALIRNQYYKGFMVLAAFSVILIGILYIYRENLERWFKNTIGT